MLTGVADSRMDPWIQFVHQIKSQIRCKMENVVLMIL